MIVYQPRDVVLKNKFNIYGSIIFHRDSHSMEYKKNPFSLKINDSVVNEIHQRNLKKKYFRCALTNIYFCPTKAENFPSEDDRWMHISFDMADKCDIYLNIVRVEHVVVSFDLGQYRVAGEKRASLSFLTQHQPLLDGQIRYFVV